MLPSKLAPAERETTFFTAGTGFFSAAFLVLFSLSLLQAFCQAAQPLPNAPVPKPGPPPAHSSTKTESFAPSTWFGVVDPGEKFAPASTRYKWMFWLHEEVSPISLVPVIIGAGWEQLIDGDPKYGSDSA